LPAPRSPLLAPQLAGIAWLGFLWCPNISSLD